MAYGLKEAVRRAAEKLEAEKNGGGQSLADLKERIESIRNEGETERPPVEKPTLPEFDAAYKEYDAPSDEELREAAESGLTDAYLSGKNGIEETAAARAEALAANKRKEEENYERTAEEAARYYDEAKRSSSDSALKRGLARSSIAQLSQDELNKSQAETRTKLAADLKTRLSELDAQIAKTNAERETALSEYDIKYAAKLTQELEKLKSERAKRQDETLEYNNALAAKLQELAMKRADWEEKYAAASEKEAARQKEDAAARRAENVYREVADYLGTLSRESAGRALRDDPYFRSVLSEKNYAKLYNVYFR